MEQFLSLKASAGSGKTFQLSIRYISLLLQDVDPSSILTLTFTNKAASEMKTRIFSNLETLGEDKNIINEITKNINLSKNEILQKKEALLQKFLTSELSIYTIDKFINKILREFGGYLNLSDDFIIANDDNDLMLFRFLNSLSFEQFDQLIKFSHTSNKKLDSIVQLFKILDAKNETLNIVEFDNSLKDIIAAEILDAAEQIKEYVLNSNLSARGKNSVDFNDIPTLLEKGKTWLTNESLIEYTYFKKDKNIIEKDQYLTIIKTKLPFYFKLQEGEILNSLFTIFNNFKSFRYKYKNKKNQFEFQDITNLVYELVTKHIDKDFLYFRLDTKYDHIIIDEFQDTSVIQYRILEPMIQEILSGSTHTYKTFFYVGDTKQSIYRFRGGNKELFDFILNHNKQITLKILDTNYRSSKHIVEFVNKTFSNLPNYEYYNQKINSDISGYVEITALDIISSRYLEAIKDKVLDLLDKGIDPNDIAILTYKNQDIYIIYNYLLQHIPQIKIVTELNAKLINQTNISIVMNYIKYYYFKETIYKATFNALMGYDLAQDIDLYLDLTSHTLEELVFKIATHYNLIDNNMIGFFELLPNYSDIIEFIYTIENDDTPMINKEQNGIKILTIYKSKGLEFKTVLLLDRINRPNPDKSSLLFLYDNIELKKIFYKMKFRENFDLPYQQAKENEEALKISDRLNTLYVALTRAKHNLIIFKKFSQSEFDILQTTFDYQTIGNLQIEKEDNKTQDIPKAVYSPLFLGIQDVIQSDTIEDQDNLKARFFGIATHYCLEMMKNFDLESLQHNIKITQSKYNHILNDQDFTDIYNRIKLLISYEPFKQLLQNSTYTKEQELSFKNEIKIIDLLINQNGNYIVVDYKTSTNKQHNHIKQVQYYKTSINQITNTTNTQGYLLYLHPDKIELLEV